MNPVPKTKAELFEKMEASRSELLRSFDGLADAQLAESGPPDGWSIQDHLAHLGAWARWIAAVLRKEDRWEAVGLEERPLEQRLSVDEENAALHENSKNWSFSEARTYFQEAHEAVKQAVSGLKDSDLFRPYSDFLPDEPAAGLADPVINGVIGNTYEHYDEHKVWIEELIALRKWRV